MRLMPDEDKTFSGSLDGFGFEQRAHIRYFCSIQNNPPPRGGVLPYKSLMGTCGQPGYVFRDFCLKQGIEFIIFLS